MDVVGRGYEKEEYKIRDNEPDQEEMVVRTWGWKDVGTKNNKITNRATEKGALHNQGKQGREIPKWRIMIQNTLKGGRGGKAMAFFLP